MEPNGVVAAKIIGVAFASVAGVGTDGTYVGVETISVFAFVFVGATGGTFVVVAAAVVGVTVVVGGVPAPAVVAPNSSLLVGEPGALDNTGGVLDCGWPGISEAGSEGGGGVPVAIVDVM